MRVELTYEVDTEVYEEWARYFAPFGLTVEEAFARLCEEVAKCGELPFTYTEEELQQAPMMRFVEERIVEE